MYSNPDSLRRHLKERLGYGNLQTLFRQTATTHIMMLLTVSGHQHPSLVGHICMAGANCNQPAIRCHLPETSVACWICGCHVFGHGASIPLARSSFFEKVREGTADLVSSRISMPSFPMACWVAGLVTPTCLVFARKYILRSSFFEKASEGPQSVSALCQPAIRCHRPRTPMAC